MKLCAPPDSDLDFLLDAFHPLALPHWAQSHAFSESNSTMTTHLTSQPFPFNRQGGDDVRRPCRFALAAFAGARSGCAKFRCVRGALKVSSPRVLGLQCTKVLLWLLLGVPTASASIRLPSTGLRLPPPPASPLPPLPSPSPQLWSLIFNTSRIVGGALQRATTIIPVHSCCIILSICGILCFATYRLQRTYQRRTLRVPESTLRLLKYSIIKNHCDELESMLQLIAGHPRSAAYLQSIFQAEPLLSIACRHNNQRCVRLLLAANADVNGSHHPEFPPPLYLSATGGYIDLVRLLLDAGANTSIKYQGKTAVEVADRSCIHLISINDLGATDSEHNIDKQAPPRRRRARGHRARRHGIANNEHAPGQHAQPSEPADHDVQESLHESDNSALQREHSGQESHLQSTQVDCLCVVCQVHKRTHAFIPCGHLCVCDECADAVMRVTAVPVCPMCRAHHVHTLRIFPA